MKVFKNNPELVMHADDFFDYTLQQLTKEGQPEAYEKALDRISHMPFNNIKR